LDKNWSFSPHTPLPAELAHAFDRYISELPPIAELLPERLRTNEFTTQLATFTEEMISARALARAIQSADERVESTSTLAAQLIEKRERLSAKLSKTLVKFRLVTTPVDIPPMMVEPGNEPEIDPVISVSYANLIDGRRLTWPHLIEFRQDKEAQERLRKFRLFAYANYNGKSQDFIKDDLLRLEADYNLTVKKWGLETAVGTIQSVMQSKIMGSGIAGSFFAGLMGAPLSALAAAGGAIALEVGKISVEIYRHRISINDALRANPISYVTYAKQSLLD